MDNGRLRITQEGYNIIVRTDFGLTVLYDTVYYVEVIVPSTYQGKMCGLCGNYNNKARDDFRLPNGKQTKNLDAFGKAWVADMPGYACGGCGGQCPVCEPATASLYEKPDSCGIMNTPNGPFSACHGKIDPAVYVSHCIFDLCAVSGNKDTLCNSVQAYALACQNAGVKIKPWRSSSFCREYQKTVSVNEKSHFRWTNKILHVSFSCSCYVPCTQSLWRVCQHLQRLLCQLKLPTGLLWNLLWRMPVWWWLCFRWDKVCSLR